jgi:hypothetical protein
MAILDYDLAAGTMNLSARKPYHYRIKTADGIWTEGKCSVVDALEINIV